MKGIELAKEFFNQYGKALLNDFSQYKDRIAVGLCGAVPVTLAYPVYNDTLKKERERVAPEILRLSEELLK